MPQPTNQPTDSQIYEEYKRMRYFYVYAQWK